MIDDGFLPLSWWGEVRNLEVKTQGEQWSIGLLTATKTTICWSHSITPLKYLVGSTGQYSDVCLLYAHANSPSPELRITLRTPCGVLSKETTREQIIAEPSSKNKLLPWPKKKKQKTASAKVHDPSKFTQALVSTFSGQGSTILEKGKHHQDTSRIHGPNRKLSKPEVVQAPSSKKKKKKKRKGRIFWKKEALWVRRRKPFKRKRGTQLDLNPWQ